MSLKQRVTIILILWLITLLELFYAYVGTRLNVAGFDENALQEQIQALRLENELLYEQVLINESLTVVATKAAALGFQKPFYVVIY